MLYVVFVKKSYLILLACFVLFSFSSSQSLHQLLKENNQIKTLEKYKDNEESFKNKLASLEEINRSRRTYGYSPVELDILASRVANMHCQDMVKYSYGGHWDSQGRKPYQRYAFYGGQDHIAENVFILQYFQVFRGKRTSSAMDPNKMDEYMSRGHKSFMAEKPPLDGHRREILNPYHTHVGIGYALGESGFRYTQEFIDRYLDFNPIDTMISPGASIMVSGKTLERKYGVYGAILYQDELADAKSFLTHQPNSYPDYGRIVFQRIPPWKMKYEKETREFRIPISFSNAKRGLYYLIIFAKENPSSIPYEPKGNADWNTEYGFPVSSIMLEVR